MNDKRCAIIFVLFGCCWLLSGCGTITANSLWKDRNISIDGKNDEWQDIKTYVMDKKVAVSVVNDNDYLYFHLVSWDREMRRMMFLGFTVWFEQDKDKMGIHFPAGAGFGAEDAKDVMPSVKGHGIPMDSAMSGKIEIVSGKGDEAIRESAEFFRTKGIEVKVGEYNNNWVYELKIPLTKNSEHPYAVGAFLGKPIKIILEIPAAKLPGISGMPSAEPGAPPSGSAGMPGHGGGMPSAGMPSGGDMPGGGMPGGGMGGPGGGFGGPPGGGMPGHGPGGFGGSPKSPKAFRLVIKTVLASEP